MRSASIYKHTEDRWWEARGERLGPFPLPHRDLGSGMERQEERMMSVLFLGLEDALSQGRDKAEQSSSRKQSKDKDQYRKR